jgi:hypothetical protein
LKTGDQVSTRLVTNGNEGKRTFGQVRQRTANDFSRFAPCGGWEGEGRWNLLAPGRVGE